MRRVLAHHDVSRYAGMREWPLAETLLAFEALVLSRAREEYRWAASASLGSEPEKPRVLRRAEEEGVA